MSLQSLAGKLNFIAKAFPLGRPFIQILYTAAVGKHPKRLVPVDGVITQDLLLWASFMHGFKGWLLILDSQQRRKASMTVFTDASAKSELGWGIYVPQKGWSSYGKWDPVFFKCYQPSIDLLEMYTILIIIDIKKHQLENCYIQFFSDNQPTVDALTNRTSSSTQLMTIIRIITLICLYFNIHFKISHIKGKDNIFADHLSHLKLYKFMQQVKESEDLVYLKPQG